MTTPTRIFLVGSAIAVVVVVGGHIETRRTESKLFIVKKACQNEDLRSGRGQEIGSRSMPHDLPPGFKLDLLPGDLPTPGPLETAVLVCDPRKLTELDQASDLHGL